MSGNGNLAQYTVSDVMDLAEFTNASLLEQYNP